MKNTQNEQRQQRRQEQQQQPQQSVILSRLEPVGCISPRKLHHVAIFKQARKQSGEL